MLPSTFIKLNIEDETIKNNMYRKVILTVPSKIQLVLMSIEPYEYVPRERHAREAQFIRVEAGRGSLILSDRDGDTIKRYNLSDGAATVVPPGLWHEIRNTGNTALKLYAIYAPPEHPAGTAHRRQADSY